MSEERVLTDLVKEAINRHKETLINADETQALIKEQEKEFRRISESQVLSVDDRNREYK